MAIDMQATWRELLRLREWTPLASTSLNTRKLSENVRKIEPGKYLIVVDSDLAGAVTNGPYVTMAVWAESDGAALRAVDGSLEADTEQHENVPPPEELLPDVRAVDYASIIAALKKRRESVLEAGEYRIASDGAFLHKVIRSSRAAYYFRSPEQTRLRCLFRSLIGSRQFGERWRCSIGSRSACRTR